MTDTTDLTGSPHLAILGAGPTGIDAALAAAEQAWSFTLYEAAPKIAGNMDDWGHVRLFSPWSLDVSPRMRAALEKLGRSAPDDESCPTGAELRRTVFEPLAAASPLAEGLQLGSRVVSVGREGLLKHEAIGDGERETRRFRLLVENGAGEQRIDHADLVFDCSGSYSEPNRLGDGGIPAPGEASASGSISQRIPDLEADAAAWRGRRVLLVGAGHSAQTAAEGLAKLAAEDDGTQVVWALRSEQPSWHVDPEDPLPERSRLTAAARGLVEVGAPGFETRLGVVIDRFEPREDGVAVTLRSTDGSTETLEVDRVLGLTGSVGDHTLYRQLQIHECYATSGPMKLAAALLGAGSSDCLAQESHGADTLVNPEPGFFILGAKSYGRNTSFLMRQGWQQVDEVMGLLADRRVAEAS